MPTYVYECSNCRDVFEVVQRITENPLDTCACGSKGTIKRLIQPVGVMFKGAGFHVNDYSTSTKQANADSATSETKPAEKTEKQESCTGEPSSCNKCSTDATLPS